jgi:TRAP transporter 4TM/12TM fusion protein
VSTDPIDAPGISEEERRELLDEFVRKRTLRGTAAVVLSAVGVSFSAFQLWLAARGFQFVVPVPFYGEVQLVALQLLQVNAIHVTFALVMAFMLFPPTRGDGFVVRRLAAVVPALEEHVGEAHPVTRIGRRLRRGVRWAALDPAGERVTPLDVLLSGVALLAVAYMVNDFTEIRRMRALGMRSGRPIQEVFPPLTPAVDVLGALGVPLGEVPYAMVLGAIGVLLVLEATRRSLGIYLMVIVASFIVYARWGHFIPQTAPYVGVLSIPELRWADIIQNLWYNTENGVFGIPVTVSVRFIYIYILFGAFLEMSGAGQWFIDLAYAATGGRKGGPAKASVLASGFMGTISGSSIANTVTTGAFTIPLMKRSGYRPAFAGAVEASASSGGQILPPVMGAAAFLIVEYTLTPFRDVIVAAAIPAIVFFFGIWVMVHLEAVRTGIGGLADDERFELWPHLRRGWFYLLPLGLLLYYLIIARLSVARSAWFTLVAIAALVALLAAYNDRTRVPLVAGLLLVSGVSVAARMLTGLGPIAALGGEWQAGLSFQAAVDATVGNIGWLLILVGVAALLLRPHVEPTYLELDPQVDDAATSSAETLGRPTLAAHGAFRYFTFIVKSMESGAKTATEVVIAVAAAGVIPGIISASGLGPNLTALILALAGGSIVVLLVVTGFSSIILGMGMPTTVTYIILVSMLGGAITEFGIPILAAHLFILYFGVLADITPPVAVAAYAASGIARSDPFETGVTAFSLSLNKAIVPFAFVLSPGILLLRGTGTGEEVRVLGLADVLDLGFFVPEVLVPVVGVFVGVIALGPTVIGYLYTDVARHDRALFAVSSLLLMAPGLVSTSLVDLLALYDQSLPVGPSALDLGLRAIGGVLFAVLVVANHRRAPLEATETEDVDVA